MSTFLGPIHYWLYNKIQLQQDLIDKLIALGEDQYQLNLKEVCDVKYGSAEKRSLEEIIDESNIHGWLQTQVSKVEYKLAYCITEMIKKDSSAIYQLEEILKEQGRAKRVTLDKNLNAVDLYKAINDSLLDGMPCDHANVILEQNEQRVIWKRNVCVHKSYWDAMQGNISNYYRLRQAWLKGFISQGNDYFEVLDEATYVLRKGVR